MPIETWKTRDKGEDGHSQRNLAVAHGEHAVLQHKLVGEPMAKSAPENQRGENHAPAAQYNGYAPYKEPPPRPAPAERAKRCKANKDTCMGWATSTGYCRPHSVGMTE
jgi:hypothetical protein